MVLTVMPARAHDPGIRGVVNSESGEPIPAATVYIWTAGVKTGYSTYCPSCYRDCGRSELTDAEGTFEIVDVDPDLLFRLLVVADGYVPTFVERVDPLKPDRVKAVLKARQVVEPDSKRVLRGIVLDAEGKPLEGAAVTPSSVWWVGQDGRPTGRGGAVEGLDPIAVTNARGEFLLAHKDDTTTWDVTIEARSHAKQYVKELTSGAARHTIRLARGGTITGMLVRNGEPVSNAEVGISHTNRFAGHYLGHHVIGTREDGRFEFVNLQSGTDWYVYAKMDAVKHLGATATRSVRVGDESSIVDIGKLEIGSAHQLSGRVVLSDGEPVPEGTQVVLSLEDAWDSQIATTGPAGAFSFTGLPRANICISAAVKGYRHSRSNPHLSWSIEGLIDRDIDKFVILLDPGVEDFAGLSGGRFRDQPIQSVTWPPPVAKPHGK